MYNSSYQELGEHLLERYLRMLGVEKRQPSINALAELVAAHLMRVPFENISKLYYRKHEGLTYIPHITTYLDGIERYNFGGTCYSNNYYLYSLLANLDYTVRLCAKNYSLKDRDELGQAVEGLFGIPQGIVKDAVGELRSLNDAWN